MTKIRNIAVIVAGGSGSRSQLKIPKQYFAINNKTILEHTLACFLHHSDIDYIQVVIGQNQNDDYIKATHNIIDNQKLLPVVIGGTTRQISVFNGLKAIKHFNPDHVIIHDAARPFLSSSLIDRTISALDDYDGAAPALPITDSLRYADDNIFTNLVDRSGLFSVQTPQAFHFNKIYDAHQCAKPDHTDDISVGMASKMSVTYVTGCQKNIKMTTMDDFVKLSQDKPPTTDIRVGHGYDVHRIIDGNGMILGGVFITCPYSLKGHSDADVLLHALTDAILGCASSGDIGFHFPPSDNRWKNVNSAIFLQKAISILHSKGGRINHIDCTLICERPKINGHRESIRENIAKLCSIALDRVNIKATTTEKLGFTGRKEGIAANAVVTSIFS